jgi:hypothetical protein
MNAKAKDVIVRAIKTFVQTAGSYLVANLSGVDFFGEDMSKTVWVGLLLSAGAAGISAVWNSLFKPSLPAI